MSPCEVGKYLCRQCGKQFSQKRPLAEHKSEVHEGVKYLCGKCDQQFTQKGNLAQHNKAVHENILGAPLKLKPTPVMNDGIGDTSSCPLLCFRI